MVKNNNPQPYTPNPSRLHPQSTALSPSLTRTKKAHHDGWAFRIERTKRLYHAFVLLEPSETIFDRVYVDTKFLGNITITDYFSIVIIRAT